MFKTNPSRISIATKMMVGFLVVILLTGAIVIVAITRLSNQEAILQELLAVEIPEAHTLWQISALLTEVNSGVQDALAGEGGETDLRRVRQAQQSIRDTFIIHLEVHPTITAEDAEILADLEEHYASFETEVTDILVLVEQGRRAEAEARFRGDAKRYFDRVLEWLHRLSSYEDQEIQKFAVQALSEGRAGRRTLTALFAIGIAASLAFSFLTTNSLTKPITKLVQSADRVAAGDSTSRAEIVRNDEIGRLAQRFNEMLDRLNRSISDQKQFYAEASHELRTPLTVIRGEADVALRGPESLRDYQEALQNIAAGAGQMSVLVDELLFLTRTESGQLEYEMEDIDLEPLLREVVDLGESLASLKEIDLTAGAIGSAVIRGDRQRLRQLFLNLLDNAIKYTLSGGTVGLSASMETGEVRILVSDSGVGIPSDEMPHIFERFYRGDTAKTTRQGGTGLGLAIAGSIAKGHGGKIDVESVVGRGTTLCVSLPTASSSG